MKEIKKPQGRCDEAQEGKRSIISCSQPSFALDQEFSDVVDFCGASDGVPDLSLDP